MAVIQKFQPFQAPIRYVFVDPDTQHLYRASTRAELFTQIVNYRSQNRLTPIIALDEVVENYLCSLPENCGKCEAKKLNRGWYRTLKGGVALLENIFYGEKNMVTPGEAAGRAAICVSCPYNTFPDKSFFLIWSDELAEASTGGKHTSLDKQLGNCEICSCTLKAKVWYRGPFGLSEEEQSRLPSFCWQNRIDKIEPKKG